MNVSRVRMGGLDAVVLDALKAEARPRLLVVLCHGYGAPGEDLVPLGEEVLNAVPQLAPAVRFVFPAALISLSGFGMYGGRAWWPIDIEALERALRTGQHRDRRNEVPPELEQARSLLEAMLREACHVAGLGMDKVVIGGFSQGAMLSVEAALSMAESPAAMCLFSGTLLCEARWRAMAPRRAGLRVLQSHGRQDPLLSFGEAEALRDLMIEAGMQVEFVPFNGEHTIGMAAMRRFVAMLEELVA